MSWLLSLFLVAAASCCVYGYQCTRSTPSSQTMALPSLPPTFQARIEANIIDKGFTTVTEEYADTVSNKAAIKYMKNGVTTTQISDFTNNQMIYIDPSGTCISTNMSSDPNNVFFGDQSQNGKHHSYSTSGILEFSKKYGETYIGTANIRGIACNHWQSCMYWPQQNANFTLDYYFSVPTWSSNTNLPVPVRAEVQGVVTNSTGATPFHHQYEYVDFRTTIDQKARPFEIPIGAVCYGMVTTRNIPKLKGAYVYREEIVDPAGLTVNNYDIYYDASYNLLRLDFRPTTVGYPYHSLDSVTEIHDFNYGIAYAIDNMVGNCTIMPIEKSSFGTSIKTGGGLYSLQMITSNNLFYLNNNYTYNGQRTWRGITCDVFSAAVPNFPSKGQLSVFDYYFLPLAWNARSNKGIDGGKTSDVPVALQVNGIGGSMGYTAYNIYNFDNDHPKMNNFDVTPCFTDDQKLNFEIIFPGDHVPTMSLYKRVFAGYGMVAITHLADISPLRIQNIAVHFNRDGTYFTGTIIEQPPSIAQYSKSVSMMPMHTNNVVYKNVTTPEACAFMCNIEVAFHCMSFDICGKSGCSLSKDFGDTGHMVTQGSTCVHYSRTINKTTGAVSINDAWNQVRDSVDKGEFVLVLQDYNNQIQRFVASGARQISYTPGVGGGTTSTMLMNQFTIKPNSRVKQNNMNAYPGLSADDCAAMCLQQDEYECHSFEFCYQSRMCTLSNVQPEEKPQLVEPAPNCDLFSKNYTSRFQQFPGTTLLSQTSYIYQKVMTINSCAKLCVGYQATTCRSFDFCPGINTCFLHKIHMFDAPVKSVQQQPYCNHYSRNFLMDFQKKTSKILGPSTGDRVIVGVSKYQCAKLCAQEGSFSCASFNYCGNYTECRLSPASAIGAPSGTLQNSMWCDHYDRKSFVNGIAYTPNWQSHYQSQSSGYSSGAMAGLAFGMIILGLIVGAAGIFAFFKFRGSNNSEMSIAFKNREVVSD